MNIHRTACALLAAALLAAPAAAQRNRPAPAGGPPTIRLGQTTTGRIVSTDPALTEAGRFKVFSFRAEAGRRYVAQLRSNDFAPQLSVARAVGGITDYMRGSSVERGETARVRFSVPATGTYLLVAQVTTKEGTGAFSLSLDTVPIRTASVAALRVGQTLEGELAVTDAEYDEASGYYDLYRVRGAPGQRVRVRMRMQGEDDPIIPTLFAGRMNGRVFEPGDAGTYDQEGAILVVVLPESGEALVQGGAYGEVTGEYTITAEARQAQPLPPTQPIRRGQTVRGELEEGDAEDDEEGKLFDLFSYTGRAGERILITMSSADFDTYVALGRVRNGQWEEIESNDDGDEGTDSVLEVELPEDGRYVIRATAFMRAEGDYQLSVTTP